MTNNQEYRTEQAELPEYAAEAIRFAIEHDLLSAALRSRPDDTLTEVTNAIAKAMQYDVISQAFQSLADEGCVVDSGERVWNEDTKSHDIVWVRPDLVTKH